MGVRVTFFRMHPVLSSQTNSLTFSNKNIYTDDWRNKPFCTAIRKSVSLHLHLNWMALTHCNLVTPYGVKNLGNFGPDSALSLIRYRVITWNNRDILLIGPIGTNCSDIPIKLPTLSFKKMHFKRSAAKYQPYLFMPDMLKISLMCIHYCEHMNDIETCGPLLTWFNSDYGMDK